MFEYLDHIADKLQDDRYQAAREESAKAAEQSGDLARELYLQEQKIEHLTLLCQSMWELLREHTGLTDTQLRVKVADVDSRDGKPDGKIGKQVFACPRCGKNCSTASRSCIMCGEDLMLHKPHIFEG